MNSSALAKNPRNIYAKPFLLLIIVSLLFLQDKAWYFDINFSLLNRFNPFDEIVAGISLFLVFFALISRHKKIAVRNSFVYIIVFIYLSVIISYIFGGVIHYGQDIFRIGRALFWFSGLLIYFFLIYRARSDDHVYQIFNLLIIYGLSAAVFAILVVTFPALQGYVQPVVIDNRFGLTRYGRIAEDSIALSFYYFLTCISLRKHHYKSSVLANSFYYIGLLITFLTIYFVHMSRQKIFAVTMTVILFLTYSLHNREFKKKVSYAFICIAIVGLSIVLAFPNNFIANFYDAIVNSLDTSYAEGENVSLALRISGIEFYFNEFLKTKLIGVGWISSASDASDNEIVQATNDYWLNFTDLGIFGALFQYGIIGIVVLILFFVLSFKKTRSLLESGLEKNMTISVTVGLFLLMKIMSLNYLFYWPSFTFFYGIIMFILDYLTIYQNPQSVRSVA